MNIPVSVTRADKAVVLVFDKSTCIYVAGFPDRMGATRAKEHVLKLVLSYYNVENLEVVVIG